jgi:hypothetical protein
MRSIIKTLFVIVVLVGGGVLPASAQPRYGAHRFEISPFAGYQFGGTLRVQDGDLLIKADMNYGGTLNVTVRPGVQMEFAYVRQDTELRLRDYAFGRTETLFAMAVEYFHIGGLYEGRSGRVRPYGLVTAGLTHFNPKPQDRSSEWRFSAGLGGGIKAFVTERLGFRFQGRLLFPYFGASSGLWCSAPGGCFVSFNGRVIVQADFTAGLILAF